MTKLHPTVADVTRAALSASAALYEAEDAQWKASVVLTSDDEDDAPAGGSLASRGQHSDPVFDTVADERRIALRNAVLDVEAQLRTVQQQFQALTTALHAASHRLHEAMDKWNGGL